MQQYLNDRLLRALRHQDLDRPPVWIMRQAGRYLPEYRAVREKVKDFWELCTTPELAAQVTLQPLARYALDAAIIFSDILTIPRALGLEIEFINGPQFARKITCIQDVQQLPKVESEKAYAYLQQAIKLVTKELDYKVPLLGFSGSPWTLACYMVEGGSSKNFAIIKRMLYSNPVVLFALLDRLVGEVISYIELQIAAGCAVIMLFDTWGGVLAEQDFLRASVDPMQRIIAYMQQKFPNIPVIVFSKNGGKYINELAATGCTGIGLDWTADLKKVKNQLGSQQIALQGNLDPCVLYADKNIIWQQVEQVLAAYNGNTGHIFNLGHGIYPDIPPENVQIMLEAINNLSARWYGCT